MLKPKLILTDNIRAFILEERRKTGLPAEIVSENIGRTKSWLSQVENGRLKNISRIDFINLISYLLKISNEEAETYIENKLNFLEENKSDIQQLTFFNIDDDNEAEKIKKEFNENVNVIVQKFNLLFDNVEDKKQALNIIKRIKSNIKSCDLGFIVSIYSLPWLKTTGREYDEKNKMIKDMINIIDENALTCEECKNCNSKKDKTITK
ncbi:MAG: hypothetical protein K0R15_650 [Clostridiales bacterium]|jgi:transcriptional regulator with XRE-family HTH domain|nr:hypothetical protein [Clostridiales bacterium]